MKRCPDCGAEVEETLYVCPKCGYKFDNKEDAIKRINEKFQYEMQTINKEYAANVMMTYAENGWKLHTAIDEGTQLLLIFERKVRTVEQVVSDMEAEIERAASERSVEIQKALEVEANLSKQKVYENILSALLQYPEGCSVNVLNDALNSQHNIMDLLAYLNDLAKSNQVINDAGKWKVL